MTAPAVGRRRALAGLLFVMTSSAGPVGAASDPRFFGEYCGTHVERRAIRVWGIRVGTASKTFTIRAQADYRETVPGQGSVLGNGTVRWDRKIALFVFQGAVTAPGRLEGSGVSPRLGYKAATGTLDETGNELTLDAFDETLHLRKTDCPNTPPAATITGPAPGDTPTRVFFQHPVRLEATATDAEDHAIPWTRFVWTSDREGLLGRGPSLEHVPTGYGRHMITVTATDHGGLSATATTEVDVLNRPPVPTIVRPVADGVYYVGVPILFRGIARDVDVGMLRGDALEWTASGYVGPIGTGQSFTRTLSAGDHLIVMLARDTTLARAATVRISVREAPEGYRPGTPSRFNFPPTVRISAPPDQGDVFVPSGGCITLRAFATDIEDGTEPFHRMTSPNAISWEETVRVLGPPGQTRPLGKGESLEMCRPSLGSHDVTARVTDSGGATASDSIHFVVQRIP